MAVAFYGEFNGAVSQLLTNISNGGTIGQKEACIRYDEGHGIDGGAILPSPYT